MNPMYPAHRVATLIVLLLLLQGSLCAEERSVRPSSAGVDATTAKQTGTPVPEPEEPKPARTVRPSSTLKVKDGEVTVLMGYNARLKGKIRHDAFAKDNLSMTDVDLVYGFTSRDDEMQWTVGVPETAEYRVAVHYTGNIYRSATAQNTTGRSSGTPALAPECVVTVAANSKVVTGELQRVVQYNEPDKGIGARQWLDGLIPLQKGVNEIQLSFARLSTHQIEAAREELRARKRNQRGTTSLGIKSLEIVRPEVWRGIEERARRMQADTRWMVEGKYGLFIHWSTKTYPLYGQRQAHETFEQGVDMFDVEAFADMAGETGASWVLFTTCHGRQMFPAPIKALAELLPGRTTKRDLIGELADALNRRNIKLMLYYNFCPGDGPFAEAVGLRAGDPQPWFDYLIRFGREVSERYGRRLAGWGYIDSTHEGYERGLPWERWVGALKAGNPDAVVGISSHWFADFTPFSDLQVADSGGLMIDPLDPRTYQPGGRHEAVRPHFSLVVDGSWIPREPYNGVIRSSSKVAGGPTRPARDYLDYIARMSRAQVPVTFNILITQDVTRNQPFVNPKTLQLMKTMKSAVWGDRKP